MSSGPGAADINGNRIARDTCDAGPSSKATDAPHSVCIEVEREATVPDTGQHAARALMGTLHKYGVLVMSDDAGRFSIHEEGGGGMRWRMLNLKQIPRLQ